ncbi:hypothetical protein SteCoe_5960 [Stentor coeruleus]|uniref:Serine/threonine-protein phosphatase 4 regulatory subunit 3-like central domain-containing protein n=1 Tax=Stentor coeruleus TaxID=5963 RepID=A0A1R2CR38_9CILI|nr:hypothetical protein SteCoe_5960 [Stentor coeruleus]
MHFGGAFWQTFKGFQFSSHSFDQLFTNENTTLSDVLDDENVIQEMKNQNSKLYDFLNPQRIVELIQLITVFPPEDADHKRGHKHPFIASEIFSCESQHIFDQFFADDKMLLIEFFKFLKDDYINTTLAGYFSKFAISLVHHNPSFVIGFIEEHGYLQEIASKVWSKSIADLALKILTLEDLDSNFCIEPRTKLLNMVISNFSSSNPLSNYFSAEILCELVLRYNEKNSWRELMILLASSDNIKLIIDAATSSDISQVTSGIRVLKAIISSASCDFLLRVNRGSNEDDSRVIQEETEEISDFCKQVIDSLTLLVRKLERPTSYFDSCVKNTTIKILGDDRIKIVEFLHICMKIGIKAFELKIVSTNAIPSIINLFFDFDMNSIYHTLVEQVINSILILKGDNDCLLQALLNSDLIDKIILNPQLKGYSGHVIRIANLLNKSQYAQDVVRSKLSKDGRWAEFTRNYLEKRNEVEARKLGENKKIETPNDDKRNMISNYLQGLSLHPQKKPEEDDKDNKDDLFDRDDDENLLAKDEEPEAEIITSSKPTEFTIEDTVKSEDNNLEDVGEELKLSDLDKPEETPEKSQEVKHEKPEEKYEPVVEEKSQKAEENVEEKVQEKVEENVEERFEENKFEEDTKKEVEVKIAEDSFNDNHPVDNDCDYWRFGPN